MKCEEAEILMEKSRKGRLTEYELKELQEHVSWCSICGQNDFMGFDVIRDVSKKIAKKYDGFVLDDGFAGRVLDGIITGKVQNNAAGQKSNRNIKYDNLEIKEKKEDK